MQHNNPLHGFTLQRIVELLLEDAGSFSHLAVHLPMRCFSHEPSVKSALSFLRKTEWARQSTEQLFIKQQLYLDATERSVPALAQQSTPSTAPAKPRSSAPARNSAAKKINATPANATPAKVWTGWTVPAKKP